MVFWQSFIRAYLGLPLTLSVFAQRILSCQCQEHVCLLAEVSPRFYFAAVLVQILVAAHSSSDVKAALWLKHLVFTPMQYDPLLTRSWCGSSWQHFTPSVVLPPLPAPFLKPRRWAVLRQRPPVDLSNAQLSLIQLSSELGSPKNGEGQVILCSQIIFLRSRIIALGFGDEEHLCRLAVLVKLGEFLS